MAQYRPAEPGQTAVSLCNLLRTAPNAALRDLAFGFDFRYHSLDFCQTCYKLTSDDALSFWNLDQTPWLHMTSRVLPSLFWAGSASNQKYRRLSAQINKETESIWAYVKNCQPIDRCYAHQLLHADGGHCCFRFLLLELFF